MLTLPRKLKYQNTFINAASYLGETKTVKLPDLERKLEPWRGGGMHRALGVDFGAGEDLMIVEVTMGGVLRPVIAQYAAPLVDDVQLRWVGSYQSDNQAGVLAYEVSVRGRYQAIARGDATTGEDTEFTFKLACAYYKEIWNGQTIIEDDPANGVLIVDGRDVMAEHRAALQV